MSSNSTENVVYLQPYDWKDIDDNMEYIVYVSCHTKDSQMAMVRIEDYEPFCNIELPSILQGRPITWSQDALKVYAAWLRGALKEDGPKSIDFSMKKKLIYYQETQYPVLTCYFTNTKALHHCINLLKKKPYTIDRLGEIKATVWETNIKDIHKFIAKNQFTYTGWLSIENPQYITNQQEEIRKTRCPIEIHVSIKNLKKVPVDICKTWVVNPRVGAIDLECYSSNHLAMPNPLHLSDVVFQCSYIDQILGKPETRKKYIIQLGACANPDGCEIIRVKTEMEVFDRLAELILQCNPAIITGYNIFRFDLPYIDDRMKHHMRDKFLPCGLLLEEETKISIFTWRSGAYGFMTISSLTTFGRIFVDMYPIIKRDYKLNSYSLDFVSKYFLKRGKHEVSPQDIFETYKETCNAEKWFREAHESCDSNLIARAGVRLENACFAMKRIAEYCAEDSCLCIDLMEKLNTWLGILILANIVEVTPVSTFSRGQQLRVVNQLYTRCFKNDIIMDSRPITDLRFKGGLVVNSVVGTHRYVFVYDFASLYPSIIMAKNICYSTLVGEERTDIPDSHCHVAEWDEEFEVEIIDQNGKKTKKIEKIHYRHRFIKQQYKKGIIPQICEDLVNERNKTRKQINPSNPEVVNMILDILQLVLKVSANSIYGGLSSRYGLPLIEGARVVTYFGRELNKKCQEVSRAHGQCVIFGDTDSIGSYYLKDIKDPRLCKKLGLEFADILSSQFEKPLRVEYEKTYDTVIFLCPKMYSGISIMTIDKKDVLAIEKMPIEAEYDNGSSVLLKINYMNKNKKEKVHLLFPKELNYEDWVNDCIAGVPVLEHGIPDETKITKKGIIIARRDNCSWVRKSYLQILLNVLFQRPILRSINIINDDIVSMMSRSVQYLNVLINKEIGSDYKEGSTYPMCVFAQELRKKGITIDGGERVDYVIVRLPEVRNQRGTLQKQLQGLKMRLLSQFIDGYIHFEKYGNTGNHEILPLDTLYYVENQMQNRIQSLLEIGYRNVITENEQRIKNKQITYKPKQRKRTQIKTYIGEDFIENYVKLLKVKQTYIKQINEISSHIQGLGPDIQKGIQKWSHNYREKYF